MASALGHAKVFSSDLTENPFRQDFVAGFGERFRKHRRTKHDLPHVLP